ncbi:MAG TPA: hypothetical protein DCZ75_09415 [Geobacter sp.]|nr:hypothetical protein [Geobacter sp.]
MKMALALLLTLALAGTVCATEIAGVKIEPTVAVNNQALKLNGSGVRKKFMIKVYIGSLYATKRLPTAAEAMRDNGDKLVRMNFLHSKIDKSKITDAFKEGFANNTPDIANSPEVKKFLALFTDDFKKGDVVDISLAANGTVTVKHNGKLLGSVASQRLATGVLAIYLGDRPADESLKQGMLGKE